MEFDFTQGFFNFYSKYVCNLKKEIPLKIN